jgi:hypothetical protein
VTAGRPPRSRPNPWIRPLALVLRLIVMGVGLGVIVGTSLKLLAPRLAQGAIGGTPRLAPPRPWRCRAGTWGISSPARS